MVEHARKSNIPFPVLRDEGNVIADRFGAHARPRPLCSMTGGVVRYQGRIDDQYGFDFQRKAPKRRDLAEASERGAGGQGRARWPRRLSPGASSGGCRRRREEGAVTFTRHIVPLLQNHCQACHRPGQIGPMPLMQYDDVVAWSGMIKEVVSDGRMPPWYADPRHGKFSNDRSLPKAKRDLLLAWIDGGMPRGNDKDMPAPAVFPVGWHDRAPDVVLNVPKEFDVPAEMPAGGIPYQHLWLDPEV